MALLVASGCYLPVRITFGPTIGPEDFQELVFIVFQRKLYKGWYLFVDDLSVATGRPDALPPGPSAAHDVVEEIRHINRGEERGPSRHQMASRIGELRRENSESGFKASQQRTKVRRSAEKIYFQVSLSFGRRKSSRRVIGQVWGVQ